jgi:hypothetical protein
VAVVGAVEVAAGAAEVAGVVEPGHKGLHHKGLHRRGLCSVQLRKDRRVQHGLPNGRHKDRNAQRPDLLTGKETWAVTGRSTVPIGLATGIWAVKAHAKDNQAHVKGRPEIEIWAARVHAKGSKPEIVDAKAQGLIGLLTAAGLLIAAGPLTGAGRRWLQTELIQG